MWKHRCEQHGLTDVVETRAGQPYRLACGCVVMTFNAKGQIRITSEHQSCRICGSRLRRRQHQVPPTANRGGYYFAWWFECVGKKRHVFLVEAAKRPCRKLAPWEQAFAGKPRHAIDQQLQLALERDESA